MVNVRNKSWIVQKYGGTSIGKQLDTICGQIIPSYLEENKTVIVCSALSGTTKSTGTTSLLLESITLAERGRGRRSELCDKMAQIRTNHRQTLEAFAPATSNGTDAVALSADLNLAWSTICDECASMEEFLLAAQVTQACARVNSFSKMT
jgi:aspartate kinase